jgi:raffinose/stachyose/melibiose transport system permease protein
MTGFNFNYYLKIRNKILSKFFLYFALTIFSIGSGYPILWMILNSFKKQSEMLSNVWGWPKNFVFSSYIDAWNRAHIQNYFLNSLIVTILAILLILLLAIFSSYVFAKIQFPGANIIFIIIIVTMIIQPQIIILPLFKLISQLHIMDTYFALILAYVADGLPLAILILTSYFKSIPSSLIEAAVVDGCNRWEIIFKIILPLSGPSIAAVIIFDFVFYWNELVLSLYLLKKENLRTITVGLTTFVGAFQRSYSSLFAALTIATIPVLIIFIFFQKRFISGIVSGAIKE